MSAKVFAVGAGKGGVGKTFVAASIGITLAKMGQSVLLLDLDLAGGNLHTTLGVPPSNTGLHSYLNSESTLANLIQPSTIPHLSYIQGIWDEWTPSELTLEMAKRLVTEAKGLPFQTVIIDLGPGATNAHLEIFNNVDEKILVTLPEPTSIEKSYRFFEAFIINQLQPNGTKETLQKLKTDLKNYRQAHKKGHFSFRNYLSETSGFSFDQFEILNQNPIRLIINGSRSHLDQQLGDSVKSVCKKYYDLSIDYLGAIDFDNAVWQSIRNKEPFLIEKPFTPLSGQFLSISKILIASDLNANNYRAVI
jgi:flagellar biosynthesis protein FlhG